MDATIVDNHAPEIPMKVNAKGQVTIPRHLRKKAGIGPGSVVEFAQTTDGNLCLWRVGRKGCPRQVTKARPGLGIARMTTEEILALTRDDR